MKAYAPSDRGTSAAVVVSQELLTATVTGLQPTKALTIFFYFAKYLCCQQAYNQGEKKLRQCSFFSKVFIFVLPAMVQPSKEGGKGFDNFVFILQKFVDYVLVKRSRLVFALVCKLCSLLRRNGFCK